LNLARSTSLIRAQIAPQLLASFAASAALIKLDFTILLIARIALSGMLFCFYSHALACGSPANCNAAGTKLYVQGKYEDAARFFLRQVDLATGEKDQASLRIGLNNLAMTALRLGKPFEANAWAQVARDRFGDDSITMHNLASIQSEPSHQTSSNLNGTYQRYQGYGRWSRLDVHTNVDGTLRLNFNIVRYGIVPSASYVGPAASGTLEANAVFKNGHLEAAYAGSENVTCRLPLQPSKLAIVIPNQDPSVHCNSWGGHNTYLDGTFWLVEEGLAQ
jgi:hypothetical protein